MRSSACGKGFVEADADIMESAARGRGARKVQSTAEAVAEKACVAKEAKSRKMWSVTVLMMLFFGLRFFV